MRIDHIGIAVRSIEETARLYRGAFGLAIAERYELPADGARVAFLPMGDSLLELMEPTGSEGSVARFLARRGEGIHHIAFGVADIRQAIANATAAGCRAVDEKPRKGARGKLIAFLHPSSTAGVLVELVEDSDA